ncbi:hypothetical protein CYLTODRAFT_486452 [Cylindrobasidium torrendii FP15055 ss-10]|uniref:AB hydrolase-1 domain-containing protein n=1 Tax=Cylindrobasidium torrendii FP15055 ss-10 TaxID=1314674 RepID=A0A0D7BRK3_9AGAR|nr:hypothetical protein CYLTODRAFT_486452 [Cylindrobasidium torrendii FP15055 ss-10]
MKEGSIVVDADKGLYMGYIDSGPPPSRSSSYQTIIAVHGIVFGHRIFERCIAAAPAHGVRFVALSRRGFPGSSPLALSELQKGDALHTLGKEICTFVDVFTTQGNIRANVTLFGWSFGVSFVLAAVHAVLPAYVSPPCIGMPDTQASFWDAKAVPQEDMMQLQIQWTTAYFEHPAFKSDSGSDSHLHKDDSKTHGDPASLNWVVPTIKYAPSIFNGMRVGTHVHFDTLMSDFACLRGFKNQFHQNLVTLCPKGVVNAEGSSIRVRWIAGTMSCATCVAGMWNVQDQCRTCKDEDKDKFQWLEGNHFVHWDEPDRMMFVLFQVV